MTTPSHMTPDEFRAAGKAMVDFIADYWDRIESFPVLSRARPGDVLAQLPAHPPAQGLGTNAPVSTLADVERTILPALTHWQSPGFFAFFPANASFPAILGEMLSAGLGVQGMLWATSPACTELEVRTLDWLAFMLDLPPEFFHDPACGARPDAPPATSRGGGVIQGTASESTLTALVAARAKAERAGARRDALVAYASTQAHSSFMKACVVAGLARDASDLSHVRLIDTDADLAMDPAALERVIRADLAAGNVPCFVMASVGTTSTTAVDPVDRIARAIVSVGAPHRPWLHVDAAHAGSAAICPEHRGMLRGIEHADSFCFNPHKWLLVNFDCDCFYVRDREPLIAAMSVTPEYLRNAASQSGAVVDFRDWHVPLGRRFRALKLWFVIRHYGVEGLRAHVREHVRLAALFESLVAADPRFELSAKRTLNLVCFRPRPRPGEPPADTDARARALMDTLNASGAMYLTHTSIPSREGPRLVLRFAVGATLTREHHVREAWARIQEALGA